MKMLFKRVGFALLIAICSVQLAACNTNDNSTGNELTFNSQDTCNFWGDNQSTNGNSSLDPDIEPDIEISVIGGSSIEQEISAEIDRKKITDIESLIYSSVQKNLEADGFEVKTGVANVAGNSNFASLGLYYYDETNFKLFGTNSMRACGFIEIKKESDIFYNLEEEQSLIYVLDVANSSMLCKKSINSDANSGDETSTVTNVCTYNYENIGSCHFVYQNQYVQYYQQTGMRVVYSVHENIKSNYDLSYGSLYDYDHKVYIYDESIFGTYTPHSWETLFSDEDYEKLKNELETISDQQLLNGYRVEEYKIVFISPESVQAYLDSEEEDTFFGYKVEDLTETFGLGTALEFTSEGFRVAHVLTSGEPGYNWKSFLIKAGIGCGIILVGAILSPVTGGASFGCALLTISKVAITYALTSALGSMAIKAVEGLMSGKKMTDILQSMTYGGLDAFANGFMIGAAVGSVGLLTGVIKPAACFVAGTPVVLSASGLTTPIQNIKIGDSVWSYNQLSKDESVQTVTNVFEKTVDELVNLTIDGDIITSTVNHPFYLPYKDAWISAGCLKKDDVVLLYDGAYEPVQNVEVYKTKNTKVYNFTVENNHTYYVGDEGVLVHNECTTLQSKRNKAVTDAWKEERNAIRNGTSKYNWSPKQIEEILKNGKLNGFAGHHIVPVNEVLGTANEFLISSPDNIVFLSNAAHTYVHAVGDSFAATASRVVEMVPWIANKIASLGLLIA